MMKNNRSLFIFGFGYTAQALAALAAADGWDIAGTSRKAETRKLLQSLGYKGVDFEADAVAPALATASRILVSTPLDRSWHDPVLAQFGEMLGNQWIGYLSTTGVYGDHQGAWVDENTPPIPSGERAMGRKRAEEQWLERGAQVFRLAGIYGSGRNALKGLKDGTARPIYKKDQVFSRIHVEDIARILLKAMEQGGGASIYNVCDDLPAASHEVIQYAAELLHLPPPELIPFEQADLSEMGREFYGSSRRVRNDKVKHELGITLLYPTYKEGLKAMLERGDY